MNADWREWVRWGVLVLLIYLGAYMAGSLVGSVLPWVMECVQQGAELMRASGRVQMFIALGGELVSVGLRFIVVGFLYCWIMGGSSTRAGLRAWATIFAIDHLLSLPYEGPEMFRALAASPMFYAEAAAACAGALYGARLGVRHRTNEHLREFRARLYRRLELE